MDDLAKRLGKRIRSLRLRNQLTQEQAAEKCGTHPVYYGKIERGQTHIGLELIETIAREFDVSPAALLQSQHEGKINTIQTELNRMLAMASEKELRLIYRLVQSVLG